MDMQLRKKQRNGRVMLGKSILLAVAIILVCISGVYADSYQDLYSYLIDLPGWEGKEPKDAKLDMPNIKNRISSPSNFLKNPFLM